MGAFLEQVAETAEWQPGTRRHPDALPAPQLGYKPKARQRATKAALTADMPAPIRRGALPSRVVETEILPRLALARGAGQNKLAEILASNLSTEDDTAKLVRLLLTQEASGAIRFLQALRSAGAAPGALLLGIVSQAARRLGELWEDDRVDFAQVTISTGRLQQAVRALSPSFQMTALTRAHPETVMLLPASGSQHTFGLVILAEFFRREGWHVIQGPARYGDDALAGLVRDNWVDVVGISVGSTGQIEGAAKSTALVRRASRNRDVGVMVGGPLLLQRPDLVARIGADLMATSAEDAVRQAGGLLAPRTAAD